MISNTKSTAGFTKRRMILATATAGLPEAFATSGFHRFNADDAFSAFHAAGLWIGPRDTLIADHPRGSVNFCRVHAPGIHAALGTRDKECAGLV
ncbi:MAG: hypothetical protein ACRERS_06170, partial [Methylococcales bacterium]